MLGQVLYLATCVLRAGGCTSSGTYACFSRPVAMDLPAKSAGMPLVLAACGGCVVLAILLMEAHPWAVHSVSSFLYERTIYETMTERTSDPFDPNRNQKTESSLSFLSRIPQS